jgi:hypothetical protein
VVIAPAHPEETAMHKTAIEQQIETAFQRLDGGELVCIKVMPLWLVFQQYLHERNMLPERLEQIPQPSFAAFVRYCEEGGMDDCRLHLAIAAIRMVLVVGGWKPPLLAGLVAPRVRVRERNSETGKYRYKQIRRES